MSEQEKAATAAWIFGMIVGALLVWVTWCTRDPYRAGQIDAANGKWEWHKVTNADGETVWTHKEK